MVYAEQWHPISSCIDSDDCRKPNGRDGYPCQGGCESYKQKTVKE